MMTKTLLASLLLTAACASDPMYVVPGTGSDMGSDTGSGSDTSDPPGSHPPGQIYGHVKDERGDTIEFSSGEPVHTHAGASIDLSTGCPAVYHYAYLNNKAEPKYGRQVTTNPLAFKVTTDTASLDPSASAYRVRTEDNHVLLDWTPMTADADGVYAMELHRDDNATMAALGTTVGKMYVDARFRDTAGTETVDTGCFENHPIAAPLNVAAPVAGELFGMTLQANSPISKVMTSSGAIVTSAAITQQTAEPINITIKSAAPTGTGTQTSVDMYVATGVRTSGTGLGSCDVVNCEIYDLAPTSGASAGPLSGVSTLTVVDDASNATVCFATQGADLTCTIPARSAAEAPHGYHLVLDRTSERSIDHANDTHGQAELTLGSVTYTAERLADFTSCTHTHILQSTLQMYCNEVTTYAHIIAVDKAKIDFNAIPMTLSASTGTETPELVPYLAASALTFPAKTWDAGDKGL